MKDPIAEVEPGAPGVRWFSLWRTLLRYVVPPILAIVLYESVRALLA